MRRGSGVLRDAPSDVLATASWRRVSSTPAAVLAALWSCCARRADSQKAFGTPSPTLRPFVR